MVSGDEAMQKIKNWCAYQERSHYETRLKLQQFGLESEQIEQSISHLIEENYLNELRFAEAFVGGKFRIKHWGKIKISNELKKHKVSELNSNKALAGISDSDYIRTLKATAEKKLKEIKKVNSIQTRAALFRYLLSRGFESELIEQTLHHTLKK